MRQGFRARLPLVTASLDLVQLRRLRVKAGIFGRTRGVKLILQALAIKTAQTLVERSLTRAQLSLIWVNSSINPVLA